MTIARTGLRRKPWLDLIGPEYIDIAFHTASARPRSKRASYSTSATSSTTHPERLAAGLPFLALAKRLKTEKVPLNAIGIQSHLRGNTPIDKPGMKTFLTQVQALGLEIQITELDVDDAGVPGTMIDTVVARKYREYLDLVGPFASLVSFQDVADSPSLPKRPDGLASRPDLFDAHYQKSSYKAVTQPDRLPKRS